MLLAKKPAFLLFREGIRVRIAIVDDTSADRETLKAMLNQYFAGADTLPDMEEFDSGEAFLASYQPKSYQIIFFDIYMEGITGMEAAREVYRQDRDCRLIFFTTSADFAVDSYQVQAAYYLMKPLQYQNLCTALDTFCAVKKDKKMTVELKGGVEGEVLLRDILYVDCVKRVVRIHRLDQTLIVANRLADIATCLEQNPEFLCCNKGIYVNMDWIQEMMDDELILNNGELLPIRIRGRGQVKKTYLRYALSHMREEP